MVEYNAAVKLDFIFGSLAYSTRRDILKRVAKKEMSVGEIANRYNLTFAAVSKHLKVLEKAKLIVKRRQGKQQFVSMAPATIKDASDAIAYYQKLWEDRFDSLEAYLNNIQEK